MRYLRILSRKRLLEVVVGSNRRLGADRTIVVVVEGMDFGHAGAGHRTGDRLPAQEGRRHNRLGWTCLRNSRFVVVGEM